MVAATNLARTTSDSNGFAPLDLAVPSASHAAGQIAFPARRAVLLLDEVAPVTSRANACAAQVDYAAHRRATARSLDRSAAKARGGALPSSRGEVRAEAIIDVQESSSISRAGARPAEAASATSLARRRSLIDPIGTCNRVRRFPSRVSSPRRP